MSGYLSLLYPDFDWEERFLASPHGGKSEGVLQRTVEDVLNVRNGYYKPRDLNGIKKTGSGLLDVLRKYKHPEMCFATSNKEMEFDIYVPALSLAFEYQGQHHYHDHTLFGSTSEFQVLLIDIQC